MLKRYANTRTEALKKNFCIIYPLYEPMASVGLRFPPPGSDDSMSHSQ